MEIVDRAAAVGVRVRDARAVRLPRRPDAQGRPRRGEGRRAGPVRAAETRESAARDVKRQALQQAARERQQAARRRQAAPERRRRRASAATPRGAAGRRRRMQIAPHRLPFLVGPPRAAIPGPLAQLAEQGTLNPKVEGSIPPRPTPESPAQRGGFRVGRRLAARVAAGRSGADLGRLRLVESLGRWRSRLGRRDTPAGRGAARRAWVSAATATRRSTLGASRRRAGIT